MAALLQDTDEKDYGAPSLPTTATTATARDEDDTDATSSAPASSLARKEYPSTTIIALPPTLREAASTIRLPGSSSGLSALGFGGANNNLISGVRTAETTDTRELARLRRKETRLAIKEAHPWQHLGIALGLPMILLFDIAVPCVIYYSWYRSHRSDWRAACAGADPCSLPPPPQFDRAILGSAIASFGIGELWILLARVHRLFVYPEVCAPLLSKSRWELDATSWVYLTAMLVALVPFLTGSTLAIPHLYLYGPSALMGFLGCLMVVSVALPFNIPVAINSQPKGTPVRPFIYYAAEDFMAVDGLQDREFRMRFNDRYETNPMFRRFFFNLTLWWTLGVCVFIGSVSAVIWTLEFHYAFGLSLGILFSYIACWAAVTAKWVNIEMKREHEAYERGDFDV